MKKTSLILTILIATLFIACNFSSSLNKDFMTGLTTRGSGLSVEQVTISIEEDKVTDNTFLYGQEIFTNFEEMNGFTIENDTYYPEMEVVVMSKAGDTVLWNKNLLGGKGLDAKLKTLKGNVILATPIQSGMEYIVKYTITDTRGEGVFYSELELKLEKNPLIKQIKKGLSAKENYIFDQDKKTVITHGEISFDNNILFDFQSLSGYKSMNGNVDLGISAKVTDTKGVVILNLPDLLENRTLTESEIQKGLGSTLKIKKGVLANPILWQVKIWDKNSDAELQSEVFLNVMD